MQYDNVFTGADGWHCSPLRRVLISAWALFVGVGFIMMANGLQGTLLGVRATMEGFPTLVTGLVMSGYFTGALVGSIVTPRLVKGVGHIRVFAALASLASIAVLVHAVWVEPLPWFVMRLVTGFSYAGLYVVAESWLNDCATNDTRGRLLSVYSLVVFVGMGGGQALLLLADPATFELFVLTSVLISVSLVPLLLTQRPAPEFRIATGISIRELYRLTPLGVIGSFFVGIAHGAFFSMGPVFAQGAGLDVRGVAWFVALALIGGTLLNWPLGRLSDRFDRRKVLVATTAAAAAGALLGWLLPDGRGPWLFASVLLFGGFSLPLYPLMIAHANDHLLPEQMTAASGALVMTAAGGLVVGPLAASALMTAMGATGLFACLASAHAAVFVFGLYRMTRRAPPPLQEQVTYVPAAHRGSHIGVALAGEVMSDSTEPGRAEAVNPR